MTTRMLTPDEIELLKDTDLGQSIPYFPNGVEVIVAEEDGQIVGHLGLAWLLHVEGAFVDPDYRGNGVLDVLIDRMHAEARERGQRVVFPASASEKMTHLLERLGAREIPARWFALDVKES